jgi:hypothetical protein
MSDFKTIINISAIVVLCNIIFKMLGIHIFENLVLLYLGIIAIKIMVIDLD